MLQPRERVFYLSFQLFFCQSVYYREGGHLSVMAGRHFFPGPPLCIRLRILVPRVKEDPPRINNGWGGD